MVRFDTVLLAGLVAVAGCGPVAKEGRAQAMSLVLSPEGVYKPRQVELKYLTDVVALKGDVANLVGGARVLVDPVDPLLQTNNGNLSDSQLLDVFEKQKGMDVRASYVEKAGVLWPADFHSWNMVSTYYNFQKAFEYWQGIYTGAGITDTSPLKGSTVLYFANFTLTEVSPKPLNDNAMFFPPVQAFVILPFDQLQTVPLSINSGVIAHEFSHRVFNRKVYGGRSLPEPLSRWIGITASTPGVNLLKAMDEGFADFNAYGTTCVSEGQCNARFLEASLGADEADKRDLSKPDKCMTLALNASMTNLGVSDFTRQGLEYIIGTRIASALYQAGMKSGKMDVLQKSLLLAYSDSGVDRGFAELISQNLDKPQNFNFVNVADTILAHISDNDLRKQVCNEFLDRLQMQNDCPNPGLCDALPHCPGTSAPGNTCSPTQ
jgi:hypothetical protein